MDASDCDGASPLVSWREVASALKPLQLRAVLVLSTAQQQCESLSALHRSLVDDMSAAGVEVTKLFCDAVGCSFDRQLSLVSDSASDSDVVLVVPWQAYRTGLNVTCSAAGCLQSAVSALFSSSTDSSLCSGAARALSLSFVEASCQEVVAGTRIAGFVLNPSPALSADGLVLLPSEGFRTALRQIFADNT